MKIFAKTFYSQGIALKYLIECAQLDKAQKHNLVQHPEDADAIIFVENAELDDYFYSRLTRDLLLKRFPQKCFIYNEVDEPWKIMPGLYCSMPKKAFDPVQQRAFPYLFSANPFIPVALKPSEVKWLFSFQGAPNHPIRKALYRIKDERALLENTSYFSIWSSEPDKITERQKIYAQTLAESAFVLCPRGAGTSSYRLFETMKASRVPVIIGDQWVEPQPMDWSFAIRVPEKHVDRIPQILRHHESEWQERGEKARVCWDDFFSPENIFNYAMEELGILMETRQVSLRRHFDLHYYKTVTKYKVRKALQSSKRALLGTT